MKYEKVKRIKTHEVSWHEGLACREFCDFQKRGRHVAVLVLNRKNGKASFVNRDARRMGPQHRNMRHAILWAKAQGWKARGVYVEGLLP